MATEVWFRNPLGYIRECAELLVTRLAWDRGYAIKNHLDPLAQADLNYPAGVNYRILMVGEQGTAEYRRGAKNPVAVYPTWEYGHESLDALEDMMEYPAGEDIATCSEVGPVDEVPVFGQEHRVVVVRLPRANAVMGRKIYGILSELQEKYPKCILHVHGTHTFRHAFGLGFGAADVEPRFEASKGKVMLPNGTICVQEDADPRWVRAVGWEPHELRVPRNRCMFNMRSAEWAGLHYSDEFSFTAARPVRIDTTTAPKDFNPESGKNYLPRRPASVGDKLICDLCSLRDRCKLFRVGAVCTLPGNEVGELAKLFNSRDSDKIISGLGALLAKEADRVQGAIEREDKVVDSGGEYDPQVTGMMKVIFDHAVKLAKLVDPKLAGGTKVQVNVGAASAVAGSTPQQLAAAVFAQLESEGMKREDITEEVVRERLELLAGEPLDV